MPAADPTAAPLSADQIATIDAYWRACCYLAVGMIYLRENSLLREPLQEAHLKHRLLGHWGASPGLSFIYVHLNRNIRGQNQGAILLAGPGHCAPGLLAPVYQEGTYSEIDPPILHLHDFRVFGPADMQIDARNYACENGVDKPEYDDWTWPLLRTESRHPRGQHE